MNEEAMISEKLIGPKSALQKLHIGEVIQPFPLTRPQIRIARMEIIERTDGDAYSRRIWGHEVK